MELELELELELVLELVLEELEEVDVVYAQDEVVVAVAAAARPETRIAEARILNYFAFFAENDSVTRWKWERKN